MMKNAEQKNTEQKTSGVIEQLKEAVQKKIYEKPEKISEEEHVASKSACGRNAMCGELVRRF